MIIKYIRDTQTERRLTAPTHKNIQSKKQQPSSALKCEQKKQAHRRIIQKLKLQTTTEFIRYRFSFQLLFDQTFSLDLAVYFVSIQKNMLFFFSSLCSFFVFVVVVVVVVFVSTTFVETPALKWFERFIIILSHGSLLFVFNSTLVHFKSRCCNSSGYFFIFSYRKVIIIILVFLFESFLSLSTLFIHWIEKKKQITKIW